MGGGDPVQGDPGVCGGSSKNGAAASVDQIDDPVARRAAEAKLSALEAEHRIEQEHFLAAARTRLRRCGPVLARRSPSSHREALVGSSVPSMATGAAQTEHAVRAWGPETIGPEGISLATGTQGSEDAIRAAVNHGVWITN